MDNQPYTDPPEMPDGERMTPAEFRMVREFLGITGDWLSTHLGVSSRTIRHWEDGRYPIPDGVRLEMEDLERRTGEFITGVVNKLMDLPDPAIITYRTDEQYHAAHPEVPFPARWHRHVVARIAQEVPALSVVYADAPSISPAPAATSPHRRSGEHHDQQS